jgi:CRISPR-associated protein Cas1
MSTVVIEKQNIALEYVSDCLLVRQADHPIRTLPLSRISKVLCMRNVQLTTQLLGQLQQRGIDFVVLNNRYVKHSFALYADTYHFALRRCQQYAWQLDENLRLTLAKAVCLHKCRVSLRLLAAQPNYHLLAQVSMAIESMQSCENEQTLRGLEGSVQRGLFEYWRLQLDPAWGFEKRIRRPPPDPVNALLSFAYTLVYHEAVRQCKKYGLDADLGFYHRLVHSRQSLACDLMEPLRPRIEHWLVCILAEGKLNKRHFSQVRTEGCFLGKEGRLLFYTLFDQQHHLFKRLLAAQARWLVKQLAQPDMLKDKQVLICK